MAILIPKGTKGAYIELLAAKGYENQREFLLDGRIELELVESGILTIYKVKGQDDA